MILVMGQKETVRLLPFQGKEQDGSWDDNEFPVKAINVAIKGLHFLLVSYRRILSFPTLFFSLFRSTKWLLVSRRCAGTKNPRVTAPSFSP